MLHKSERIDAALLAAHPPHRPLLDQAFEGSYLILALIVFSLTFPGTPPKSISLRGLVGDVMSSWFVVVALLLLIGWATRTLGSFDPRVILAWVFATPVALFAARALMPVVLLRLLAAEGVQRVAVIAGEGELGRKLAERIRITPFLGIRLAGFFDDRSPERIGAVEPGEILGPLSQVAAYVKTHHVDLIYVTLPMASQPRILKLLDELHDTTASIYFVPDIFLFDLIQARMDTIGGIPVVAACETPFYGISGLIKRASDIVLASVILLLILPLMLAIAVGIKLSSPGPALFKQFFNVLQGRMSVVGPRPHAVAHNEMYRRLIKGYMIRHKVRPGITGLAQVNGLRGETETLDKMQARIEHDLEYLRNWSLQLDLQIVVKTIFVLLKKPDAF